MKLPNYSVLFFKKIEFSSIPQQKYVSSLDEILIRGISKRK